jgi:transcriptional regulator with XRE-family HTH domain
MSDSSLGAFLAILRKARGLTQQDVADALYVSNKTVSKWERSESAPDIAMLPALAEFFGVTCDELPRGERIPTADSSAGGSVPLRTEERLRRLSQRVLTQFRVGAALSALPVLVGLPLFFCLFVGDAPYPARQTTGLCAAIFLPLWALGAGALAVLFSVFRGKLGNDPDAVLADARRQLNSVCFLCCAADGAALFLVLAEGFSRLALHRMPFWHVMFSLVVFPLSCWAALRGAASFLARRRALPPSLARLALRGRSLTLVLLQGAAWLPALGSIALDLWVVNIPNSVNLLLVVLPPLLAAAAVFVLRLKNDSPPNPRRGSVRVLSALISSLLSWGAWGALFAVCGAAAYFAQIL